MTARFEPISTVVNIKLEWRLNASSGSNYSSSYEYIILNSELGNRVSLLFYGTTSNTMTGDDDIAYPLTVVSNKEECYRYYYSEVVDYDGNSIGRDGTPSSFDLLIDNKVILSKLQPETPIFELSFLNGKSYTAANYKIFFSVSRK